MYSRQIYSMTAIVTSIRFAFTILGLMQLCITSSSIAISSPIRKSKQVKISRNGPFDCFRIYWNCILTQKEIRELHPLIITMNHDNNNSYSQWTCSYIESSKNYKHFWEYSIAVTAVCLRWVEREIRRILVVTYIRLKIQNIFGNELQSEWYWYNCTGTYLLIILLYLTSYINECSIKRLKNPHQRTAHQPSTFIDHLCDVRETKTGNSQNHTLARDKQWWVFVPYTVKEYISTDFLNVEYQHKPMRGWNNNG